MTTRVRLTERQFQTQVMDLARMDAAVWRPADWTQTIIPTLQRRTTP